MNKKELILFGLLMVFAVIILIQSFNQPEVVMVEQPAPIPIQPPVIPVQEPVVVEVPNVSEIPPDVPFPVPEIPKSSSII